jgi:hypothetical protein
VLLTDALGITLWWYRLCYSVPVNTNEIITALDTEIARLQEARMILAGGPAATKRRILSPEARAKIAAAQRKRWAKAKRG